MRRAWMWVIVAAIGVSACGRSEQQKQADEAAKQIEAAARELGKAAENAGKASGAAANDAAKGLEAMAKGLGAMVSGAAADGKTVEPVSFRDLQALFPTIDGWEKQKPTGEKMSARRSATRMPRSPTARTTPASCSSWPTPASTSCSSRRSRC